MTAGDGISFGTRKRCTACNGIGWVQTPPSPMPAPQRPPAPAQAFYMPPMQPVTNWLTTHTPSTDAEVMINAMSMADVEPQSDDGFFMADSSREYERGRDFMGDTSAIAARNAVPVAERPPVLLGGGFKGGGGTFASTGVAPAARRRQVYSSNNSAVQRMMALTSDAVQSIATHAMSLDEMLRNNAQAQYNGVTAFRTT